MKKSIYLLLFLFLVLVVTCVYQKTFTIYENTHAKDENTKQAVKIETPVSLKKEPVVEKESVIPVTHIVQKEEQKSKKIIEKPSKELSFLEKIKSTVASAMTSNKEVVPAVQKEDITLLAVIKKDQALSTNIEEKEVVDYLLEVLKEQDLALSNRDEAESRLHALITQVLEERHTAIQNMEKASLDIDTRHQKRLDERDIKSKNIYTINTEEGK